MRWRQTMRSWWQAVYRRGRLLRGLSADDGSAGMLAALFEEELL